MNPFSKATRLLSGAAISLLLLLAGCSERPSFDVVSEQEDPVFRRARDLHARGMHNEALENFLRLIQKRNGNAPESHLDAGNIYLNHLRDPISAIYHFKRYEALLSRSSDPEDQSRISLVRDLIKGATKEFATTFDAKVYQDPLERLKLLDTIEMLRSENELLKRQLSDARTRLNGELAGVRTSEPSLAAARPVREREAPMQIQPRRADPQPSPPAAAAARTYVVRPGDNLYNIARKVYGDSSRWREILEANRDAIPDESSLKVGATLRLP